MDATGSPWCDCADGFFNASATTCVRDAAGCETSTDCDDGNLCTDDLCLAGQCRHEPNQAAKSAALDSSGGLVLAGMSEDDLGEGRMTFTVARLNPDGTLDETFGVAGAQRLDRGSGGTVANGIAVDPAGRILAAGHGYLEGQPHDYMVARMMPDGQWDSSFNGRGWVAVDVGGDDFGNAPLLAGASIYVAGTSWVGGTGHDCALARTTRTGAYDATFASNGRLLLDVGGGNDGCPASVVMPDGGLMAGGSGSLASGTDSVLWRVDAAGALDPAFGAGGRVVVDFGGDDTIRGLLLLPDGRILAVGAKNTQAQPAFLAAVFDDRGALIEELDLTAIPDSPEQLWHATLDLQGRVLLFGETGDAPNRDFVLIRIYL